MSILSKLFSARAQQDEDKIDYGNRITKLEHGFENIKDEVEKLSKNDADKNDHGDRITRLEYDVADIKKTMELLALKVVDEVAKLVRRIDEMHQNFGTSTALVRKLPGVPAKHYGRIKLARVPTELTNDHGLGGARKENEKPKENDLRLFLHLFVIYYLELLRAKEISPGYLNDVHRL